MKHLKCLCLILLISTISLEAFSGSIQCSNVYRKRVQTVDRVFEVDGYIAEGDQSIIYRLAGGKILRVFKTKFPEVSSQRFLDGYNDLVHLGLKDIVGILESGRGWVIQREINVEFDLNTFMRDLVSIRKSDINRYKKLLNGLRSFVMQTVKLDDIGDFHGGQLVWTGKKWMLVDWNHSLHIARRNSEETILWGLELSSEVRTVFDGINERLLLLRQSGKNYL